MLTLVFWIASPFGDEKLCYATCPLDIIEFYIFLDVLSDPQNPLYVWMIGNALLACWMNKWNLLMSTIVSQSSFNISFPKWSVFQVSSMITFPSMKKQLEIKGKPIF